MKCQLLVACIALASASCSGLQTVTLPLGYRHVGVKAVLIRAAEPGDYTDMLAEKCVRVQVERFPSLFVEVHEITEADLELVVSGSERSSTKTNGTGFAIGNGKLAIGGNGSSSYEKPATRLDIAMYTRSDGLIYQNSTTVPKHPNSGMEPAARRLIKEYAKGR